MSAFSKADARRIKGYLETAEGFRPPPPEPAEADLEARFAARHPLPDLEALAQAVAFDDGYQPDQEELRRAFETLCRRHGMPDCELCCPPPPEAA